MAEQDNAFFREWDVHKENTMKRLLFGAVITMIAVSPALAGRGDIGDGSGSCKACPSWRSPASSDMPPVGSAFPVCRLVKERIGTRHGHPVYQTRQVCG
jgi:hypothetical protein